MNPSQRPKRTRSQSDPTALLPSVEPSSKAVLLLPERLLVGVESVPTDSDGHTQVEKMFLLIVIIGIIITFVICVVLGATDLVHHSLDFMFIPRSLVLLVFESIWQALLSFLALRYKIKINYTRKMAHLARIPKFFFSRYLPGFDSNPITVLMVFAFSQLIYSLMFMRWTRDRIKTFAYIFISQIEWRINRIR